MGRLYYTIGYLFTTGMHVYCVIVDILFNAINTILQWFKQYTFDHIAKKDILVKIHIIHKE